MRAPAVALLGALALFAAPLAAQSGSGGAMQDRTDRARPLIERSVIVAPRVIGEFTFENSHFDPAQRAAGARFRYAPKGHQETRFDVFVFPAGRMSQAEALDAGMAAFKQDVRAAEKYGQYRDVDFRDESVFPLDLVSSDDRDANADEAKILAVIAGAQPSGRRLRMHYTQAPGDFAMQSNGYLFYRHLYYYKVRVSAARDRIDEPAFLALADGAARTLVRAIETFNAGACEKKEITIDSKADAETAAMELVRQSALLQGYNCDGAPDATRLSGEVEVVRIDFQPSDWNAE